jgi:CBS domain-containing protein
MKVSEIMTRGVVTAEPHWTLQEAAARMSDLDIGPLPVCDNGRLVGVITDRDIAVRAVAHGHDAFEDRVRDVMTPEVIYCFDDQDVAEAARLMKDRQVRRLPVVNRDRRLVGILSLGDVAVETEEVVAGNTLEGVSRPTGPNR